ncbi:tyrosine-protein kinase family protein [Novosphingobium tardum]|uniref:Tyrosine-protein kinase family protein n=1 Tax=Novosphingobium tardum TaxID=1538021 RepID=A0ABV8RMW4_9SPHN
MLQLLRLPPSLWTALPGRGDIAAALDLAGSGATWQPLSISPPRTFASLLSLVPPLLMMAATASASPATRRTLLQTLVELVLLSALVGMAQVATGAEVLRFYSNSHMGYLTGFQANRNAQADVLAIAVMGTAALYYDHSSRRSAGWAISCVVMLLLALLLTGSRAGVAIGTLVTAFAALWLGRTRVPALGRVNAPIAAAALAVTLAAGWASGLFGKLAQRGSFGGEARPQLAAHQFAAVEPNLTLIPSGPIPPSPTELLSTSRFSKLLDEMEDQFDVVVIDSPPVLGLADAPLISALVDGVVMVVEANGARRGSTRSALGRLRMMNSTILGAVLTKFRPEAGTNRYSAYYGAQYYHYKDSETAPAAY